MSGLVHPGEKKKLGVTHVTSMLTPQSSIFRFVLNSTCNEARKPLLTSGTSKSSKGSCMPQLVVLVPYTTRESVSESTQSVLPKQGTAGCSACSVIKKCRSCPGAHDAWYLQHTIQIILNNIRIATIVLLFTVTCILCSACTLSHH